MFRRLWVQIPAPYTGWTFFTFIYCKNCSVCLKKTKINEKVTGDGPFLSSYTGKVYHVVAGLEEILAHFCIGEV